MQSIAIFAAHYPPHMGGLEQYNQNLSRALVAMGVRVDMVTYDFDGSTAPIAAEDGVKIYRLPCHPLVSTRYPVPIRDATYRRLMDDVSSRRHDGVLINARFYPHTVIGLKFAQAQGLRAVVLDHGSSYLKFGNPAIDWVVRAYEHAITAIDRRYDPDFYGVSEMSRDWLSTFGIRGRGVLHNAIDARQFRDLSSGRDFRAELGIPADAFVVTFTARLVKDKGTDVLMDTAHLLEGTCPRVRFLVAGSGPELDHMRAEAPANLLALGRLARPDISSLLQQSDAFCFPSWYPEGLPTSILEASACGLPSVATNVGGVREVIPDDSYGSVYQTPKAETFADRLAWYADNPTEARRQGDRVRQRVEETFSWPKTADAVVRACEAAQR